MNCYQHVDRIAVAACSKCCGRALCTPCAARHDPPLCAACAQRVLQRSEMSTRRNQMTWVPDTPES